MITIALSLATAALFGVADYWGGVAARRDAAIAVTGFSHLVGLTAFALAVVVAPAPFTVRDVLAGAVAGVAGGVGVAALYGALAAGRMSVVAPVTAALSGGLPALYDLATGGTVGPLQAAGLVLALVATVLVSTAGAPEERRDLPPLAIGLAVLAGTGFAGGFVAFSLSAPTSGFVPLLAARAVSASLLLLATAVRHRRVALAAPARGLTAGAGALDAAANVTMLSAIRTGPLAVASVLGSLYPVVTILLARVFLGERLRGAQRAGVALALAAVVLSALR